MKTIDWLENIKAIIIDDDINFAKSIEGFLSDFSAIVTIVTNPNEALDTIEKIIPDLIFLDLQMPKMSGLDLLPVIREVNKSVPIIIVSGTIDIVEAVETVKTGADDFVSKPILNFDEFGLIIKNVLHKSELKKEIENYRNNLELLVDKRTNELKKINHKLLEEIEKRKTAESLLKEGASNVMKTLEANRKQLSKDLHDSIGQKMVFLKLNLELALKNSYESAKYIEIANESVTQISSELSSIVKMLYPQSIEKYSLSQNIDSLVDSFRNISSLKIKSIFTGNEPALDKKVKLNIYRVFQEALNNITKHADASTVIIIMEFLNQKMRCEIIDDGIGIDKMKRTFTSTGFFSMEERIAELNGKFNIESEQGKGVRIYFEISI
jgi:signal transduction histidine kinase